MNKPACQVITMAAATTMRRCIEDLNSSTALAGIREAANYSTKLSQIDFYKGFSLLMISPLLSLQVILAKILLPRILWISLFPQPYQQPKNWTLLTKSPRVNWQCSRPKKLKTTQSRLLWLESWRRVNQGRGSNPLNQLIKLKTKGNMRKKAQLRWKRRACSSLTHKALAHSCLMTHPQTTKEQGRSRAMQELPTLKANPSFKIWPPKSLSVLQNSSNKITCTSSRNRKRVRKTNALKITFHEKGAPWRTCLSKSHIFYAIANKHWIDELVFETKNCKQS